MARLVFHIAPTCFSSTSRWGWWTSSRFTSSPCSWVTESAYSRNSARRRSSWNPRGRWRVPERRHASQLPRREVTHALTARGGQSLVPGQRLAGGGCDVDRDELTGARNAVEVHDPVVATAAAQPRRIRARLPLHEHLE